MKYENDSDAAFEELFESYQHQMLDQGLFVTRKMKPNVSKGWLKSVQRQLNKLEKQQAQRSGSKVSRKK